MSEVRLSFSRRIIVHIPVVVELLKSPYDCLFGLACTDLRKKDVQEKLEIG